jgi:hypothetical protein
MDRQTTGLRYYISNWKVLKSAPLIDSRSQMMLNETYSLLLAEQKELEILKKNVDFLFLIIMGNFVFCNYSFLLLLLTRSSNAFKTLFSLAAWICPLRIRDRSSKECRQRGFSQFYKYK